MKSNNRPQVPHNLRANRGGILPDDDLHKIFILRSSILWSMKYIERMITELSFALSNINPYKNIEREIPFLLKSRTSYMQECIRIDGPLVEIRPLIQPILNKFEKYRDLRNTMAHGDIRNIFHGKVYFINNEISRKDNTYSQNISEFDLAELEILARNVAQFSRAVQRIWYRYFKDDYPEDVLRKHTQP